MGPHIWPSKSRNDQLELTYSSYVRTQDVTLRTCQRRWKIGRSDERGSGISVLAARHDDDEIYIYIYRSTSRFLFEFIYFSSTLVSSVLTLSSGSLKCLMIVSSSIYIAATVLIRLFFLIPGFFVWVFPGRINALSVTDFCLSQVLFVSRPFFFPFFFLRECILTDRVHVHVYILSVFFPLPKIRGAYDKGFQTFFVWAFKVVVDC